MFDALKGNKSETIALALRDYLSSEKRLNPKVTPYFNADIPTWREHLSSLTNDEKIIEYNRVSQIGRLIKERIWLKNQ